MIKSPPHAARRRSRGVGLLDALIAIVILSFGLLGLTRMQTGLIAQTTEAQERLTAVQLADELMSTVIVDTPNAGCYVLPTAGTCAATAASSRAAAWLDRVGDALTDGTATAVIATAPATGVVSYTLTINWTGKAPGADGTPETRTVTVITDVRPN